MILEKPEIFYKIFPYNYWLFKAEMIKSMLENGERFQDSEGNLKKLGGDLKQYQQMLKYELHFTYYHQAEALFELIFALEKLDNKHVWLILSKPEKGQMRKFAQKVSHIAKNSSELKDKMVDLTDGSKIPFYEWLLYDAFQHGIEEDNLKITLEKVDDIIQMTAKDLTDKGQYNAFKHGMRVLPLLKKFSVSDKEQEKTYMNFDLDNSFTYLEFPKEDEEKGIKKGDIQEITIGYSPEQDMLKINLITMLMTGIIESRKAKFFGEGKKIQFRDFDILKEVKKKNIGIHQLVFTHHFDVEPPQK